MNKLISLKFLSKEIPKSFSNYHSHSLKPFHSLSTTHLSQPNNHLLPSPYFILSKTHLWNHPTIHGFLSKSLLSEHFVSSARFKGLMGPNVAFVRTQFPKVKPSSWASSSSQRRGWSSWSQGFNADNVVLGLIVANTAVFMLWRVMNRDFMYENFTISLYNVTSGRIHTMLTSAFSHIDFGHFISNMLGLYFFGDSIGRIFGSGFVLKLYLAGGFVGSIFYLVHQAFADNSKNQFSSTVPGLGASGAVNAIMLLDIFLFPKATIMLQFFIPVPAMLLGVILIGKDVLRIIQGDPQISGAAHLGGAAVAAAAWLGVKRGIRF